MIKKLIARAIIGLYIVGCVGVISFAMVIQPEMRILIGIIFSIFAVTLILHWAVNNAS